MNTLALVAVSVPLALAAGLLIGILANEVPRLKRPVQATLDVMQTVPTFAYLTPLLLLFGFGPVVGLIASAIYAAPPMARNVILGLERVEPEIKEAAIMSGGARWQQLFLVEIPSASIQIGDWWLTRSSPADHASSPVRLSKAATERPSGPPAWTTKRSPATTGVGEKP